MHLLYAVNCDKEQIHESHITCIVYFYDLVIEKYPVVI